MSSNRWFSERRHLFVKNLLQEFHETFDTFLKIYEHYISTRQVSYEEIELLVGTESRRGLLWLLKDDCHRLWRDADPKEELHGCLFDWVVGSLFHEAMKLKENAYMYYYYRPLAREMAGPGAVSTVRFCGVECHRFMERTVSEIRKQMENLGFMFGRANYLLRTMLPDQAHNALLVRFLCENGQLVDALWAETVDQLFAEMYPLAPETGYCVAARSYLDDQWHRQALAAYERALAINPQCEEALRHRFELLAVLREHEVVMKNGTSAALAAAG